MRNLLGQVFLWCLGLINLNADLSFETRRLSLPSEGLVFQNFDNYPPKKGAWYSQDIEGLRMDPVPEAAFRSRLGMRIHGKITGEAPSVTLPLNPDGSARRIDELRQHRGRLMVRARHWGVLRYLFRDEAGLQFHTKWVKFSATAPDSFLQRRESPIVAQTWATHWQHIDLPAVDEEMKGIQCSESPHSKPKGELFPYALEFRFSPHEKDFDLHVDEFVLDIGYMVGSEGEARVKMPLYNVTEDLGVPHLSWTMRRFEGWTFEGIALAQEQISSSYHSDGLLDLRLSLEEAPTKSNFENANVTKANLGSPKGVALVEMMPSYPIRIARDEGVVGLRFTMRSSGLVGGRLHLKFREEKIREHRGPEDPKHESFATNLPLDFRGRRNFEVPLNFTGLPLRENYRRHNKIIDGYLELESMTIWVEDLPRDPVEYRFEWIGVEQWVEEDLWNKVYPMLAPQRDVAHPKQQSFLDITPEGTVLRDFRDNPFNQAYKKNRETDEITFREDEVAAIGTPGGVWLSIPPRNRPLDAPTSLEATLFFNQRLRSSHSKFGLGEHQGGLSMLATAKGVVQYLVEDAKERVLISPAVSFEARPSILKAPVSKEEKRQAELRFPMLKADGDEYLLLDTERKAKVHFPVQPWGLRFTFENVLSRVEARVDDLLFWDEISEQGIQSLGLKKYQIVPSFYRRGDDLVRTDWFSLGRGWRSHQCLGVASFDLGLSENEILQSMSKDIATSKSLYEEAQFKLDALRELDATTTRTLRDYFYPDDRAPQVAPKPKIQLQKSEEASLALEVEWLEQPALEPWLRWGASSVILESWPLLSQEEASVPLDLGIVGLRLLLFSSGHHGTALQLIFEDDKGLKYRRAFPLEKEGLLEFRVPFDHHGFEVTNRRGSVQEIRELPKSLFLRSVNLVHRPHGANHGGRQRVILYTPEWIVDRKVMTRVPPSVRSLLRSPRR